VFKAHRLVYHSTLGSRVIKKKKKGLGETAVEDRPIGGERLLELEVPPEEQ